MCMNEKKPVALWKGIVGIAVSSFLLMLAISIYFPFYFFNKLLPDWTLVWFIAAAIVGTVSLIVSIINLNEAIAYKKTQPKPEKPLPTKKEDNTELLHKLLAEGKITIEEYDRLKNN